MSSGYSSVAGGGGVLDEDQKVCQKKKKKARRQSARKDNDEKMRGLSELVTSCLSATSSSSSPKESKPATEPFLRSSQFSRVPPTICFYTKGTRVTKPAKSIANRLNWCNNTLLPIVMRNTLAASHFSIVDESMFFVGYWGRHLKSARYKELERHHKVNHFPGGFHIGRKDRLWMHIRKQQERFGDDFDITPHTYILPHDREEMIDYLNEDESRHVIIKPPASARGTGILVTRNVDEIPSTTAIVAQCYVDRPLTINNAKFDLRIYACVTSMDPLKIYVYEQGLVRFASVPYSSNLASISNKYMHLTNYSINKLAEKDGVANKPVPKWSLSQLWPWLEERGMSSTRVRQQIDDVIIKALISCEKPIRDHMNKYLQADFICYELFGIDILLDEHLKPWLLEVNISPSLHSGTPLDISVKAPLAKDVLNLAGITVPPESMAHHSCNYVTRPRNVKKSAEQMVKETAWLAAYRDSLGDLDPRILKRLTPEDARVLVDFEDELRRCGAFRLIFPTRKTCSYQRYFAEPIYANLMLQQWQLEHDTDRSAGIDRLEQLCRQGHLESDYSDD